MGTVDSDLRYLSHEINGSMYGAWYRLTSDGQVEIYWHARIASAPCDGDSPQLRALKLLKDLIRAADPSSERPAARRAAKLPPQAPKEAETAD